MKKKERKIILRWACPYCQHELDAQLHCQCGFAADFRNSMYYIHRTDESWDKCMIERCGWIEASKERGVYVDNDDHFFLPDGRPHLREFYKESKTHIDKFIAVADLNGRLCLDLGASLGWVETYMLRCIPTLNLIALEVNDDPICGLGRAESLKRRAGVDFTCLVADMHYIPLANNSVDLVFSVDALHHFRNLDVVFKEIHRVLRPRGTFYGLNEPDRPDGADEDSYVKSHIEVELRHGIIERRPTIAEYLKMGECLNLRVANDEVNLAKNVLTAGLFLAGVKT